MVYREVTIDGESLTFRSGGSTYDMCGGSDSFSDDSIELFGNGTSQNAWNVPEWEESFVEMLNPMQESAPRTGRESVSQMELTSANFPTDVMGRAHLQYPVPAFL